MTQTPEARPRAGRLPRTARRAQLLDIALEVFVEQGYHSASMDEIAERAGVSKPVLYQHFPGKLELYTALVTSAVDTVIEGVREALASTQNNAERVQATMRLWYDCVADEEKAFRLVFESDLTSDPAVRDLIGQVTTKSSEDIAEVIVEDTGLSRDAAQLLAAGLVGIGHVGARMWLSSDSDLSREDAVTLASNLAWRGISGFPKPTTEGDD